MIHMRCPRLAVQCIKAVVQYHRPCVFAGAAISLSVGKFEQTTLDLQGYRCCTSTSQGVRYQFQLICILDLSFYSTF